MNAETDINLPSDEIRIMGIYSLVKEQKPVSISIEDMPKILALTEELHLASIEDAPKLEKIAKLESVMEEKMIQIQALRGQLNQKLLYLSAHPEVKIKPMSNNASVSLSPINETTVLETLKANPYGLGNADICRKIGHGMTGNKQEQNKAWSVAKQLEAKGLVKSENRMWKIV